MLKTQCQYQCVLERPREKHRELSYTECYPGPATGALVAVGT